MLLSSDALSGIQETQMPRTNFNLIAETHTGSYAEIYTESYAENHAGNYG